MLVCASLNFRPRETLEGDKQSAARCPTPGVVLGEGDRLGENEMGTICPPPHSSSERSPGGKRAFCRGFADDATLAHEKQLTAGHSCG